VADGTHPCSNNKSVDPSFGVTSPILLDALATSGQVLKVDDRAELSHRPGVTG